MSSNTARSSTIAPDSLSNCIMEVKTESESVEELATLCKEQATELRLKLSDLVALIDDVLLLDTSKYLHSSLKEMELMCIDLGGSFDSMGAWYRSSGQVRRLLDVVQGLEKSDIKDLWRWQGVQGDIANLNRVLDSIRLALEVDTMKLGHIITSFEQTFVVSKTIIVNLRGLAGHHLEWKHFDLQDLVDQRSPWGLAPPNPDECGDRIRGWKGLLKTGWKVLDAEQVATQDAIQQVSQTAPAAPGEGGTLG
ncbi:hypothetical protein BR93DRAFT_971704 [Coniochaeta sp. PMI_546]|nr:hypothetical protein BR93DRAFT_971704 [Coniochaeta sp. PMI_546]